MNAVWARARAELRRRWLATVVLAVLVGVAGGAAMTALAGSLRTETAMARFVSYSRPNDVFVVSPEGELDLDAVARLPQVADHGYSAYLHLTPSTPSGEPDPASAGSINPFVRISEQGLGATSDIPYVVHGRVPDRHRALEVAVNEEVASRYRLRPGSTLRMWAYSPAQHDESLAGTTRPDGPVFDFTVTGIIRLPFDLDPVPRDPEVVYTGRGTAYLGPAFWAENGDEVAASGGIGQTLDLRLRPGSDVDAFQAAVRALPGGDAAEIQLGSEATKVQRQAEQSTRVEAAALLAFAALAALAGLLIVGQALSRQVQLEAVQHPTLLALGMTRAQLVAAAVVRAAGVAVPGGLLAAAAAVAASPLTPIGLARRAEVDPGLAVDLPVLAGGTGAVTGAVLAGAALAAWRSTSARAGRRLARRSRVVERLAGAGAPGPAVAGVSFAVDGGGPGGRALVRTAIVGTLAAVGVATAAMTFGASLGRMASDPERYGWGWDVVVGNLNAEEDLSERGAQDLAARPFVEGFTALTETLEPLRIGGLDIDAAGAQLVKGDVFPPLTAGRPPVGTGEVVLGARTMERLGVAVGDRVEGRLGGQTTSLLVVGRAVLHPAVQFSFSMGEGAILSLDELRRLTPEAPATHFLVRYADGVDEAQAFAALQAGWGKTVLRPQLPVEVQNLRRVAGLPNVLAGLVAVLAAGTLAHSIGTSVRRRRRDLAVLKSLGFRRREVAATVGCQATTMVGAALAAGVPLGIAAGRWSWRAVAAELASPPAVTPLVALLLIIGATIVLANLVAAVPASTASRVRPASALRVE